VFDIRQNVSRFFKFHSYVLFNRQPSLHKMSMMSHRVRLMPYSSKFFPLSFPKPIIFFVTSFPPEPIGVSIITRKGFVPSNLCIERPRTMRTLMVTK
jgi:hypothetical protein